MLPSLDEGKSIISLSCYMFDMVHSFCSVLTECAQTTP